MSLISELAVDDALSTISFPTNTLLDLATGKYVQGHDGKFYLTGGLTQHINAGVGPSGAFKSTLMCSLLMRCASIFPDSEVLIEDTENALDRDRPRAYRMAEDLYQAGLEGRVTWVNSIDYTLDELFKLLKEICQKKEADKKNQQAVSPFIDLKTGKPLTIWKPTFVFIDSLTELSSDAEKDAIMGDKAKSLSDANTVFMTDGNKKTIFIRAMKTLCMSYGIVLIVTGHYDRVMQIDPYNPIPKDTLFSQKDYKTKGTGTKLKFLASLFIRTYAATLLDSNKEPLYGIGAGPVKDVMEIDVTIERSKTSSAGEMLPFVATQSDGVLTAVTNYHYLRTHEYYGLSGNKQKQQSPLLPDVTLSRNTIRELSAANYELRRALEITAQYCYIQNNWNSREFPVDFTKSPNELFDKLLSDKNKNLVSDILNSRGYWTYVKHDRKYMDLFEILMLAGFKR